MCTWKTLPSFTHPDGTDMWKLGSWPMDYYTSKHYYLNIFLFQMWYQCHLGFSQIFYWVFTNFTHKLTYFLGHSSMKTDIALLAVAQWPQSIDYSRLVGRHFADSLLTPLCHIHLFCVSVLWRQPVLAVWINKQSTVIISLLNGPS